MTRRLLVGFWALGFAVGCGSEAATDDDYDRELASMANELTKTRGGKSKGAAAGFDRQRVLDALSQGASKRQLIGNTATSGSSWKLCLRAAVSSGLGFTAIRNQCDSLFGK